MECTPIKKNQVLKNILAVGSGAHKSKFLANWSQMINQLIGPDPNLWFSQTRPCFIQNYMVNALKLQNSIKYQGVWAKMIYKATTPEPMWNVPHVYDEHNM